MQDDPTVNHFLNYFPNQIATPVLRGTARRVNTG